MTPDRLSARDLHAHLLHLVALVATRQGDRYRYYDDAPGHLWRTRLDLGALVGSFRSLSFGMGRFRPRGEIQDVKVVRVQVREEIAGD